MSSARNGSAYIRSLDAWQLSHIRAECLTRVSGCIGGNSGMRKLVLIGGGYISDLTTLAIDRRVVEMTGVTSPRALFIPTASNDEEQYYVNFQHMYGNLLGCNTDVLMCIRQPLTLEAIEEKFLSSDLIYIGGGNYLRLMNVWKELGINELIIKALDAGIVMAGISAGAIYWFRTGLRSAEQGGYTKDEGIGLIPAFHCPHYNQPTRSEAFQYQMKTQSDVGIALEDNVALAILGDSYHVISSQDDAKAYKMINRSGNLNIHELRNDCAEMSLPQLFYMH